VLVLSQGDKVAITLRSLDTGRTGHPFEMGKVADGQWAGDGVVEPSRSDPLSSALGHL
jgi:hypothetical protein